jgi:hypothetical protein
MVENRSISAELWETDGRQLFALTINVLQEPLNESMGDTKGLSNS